MVSKGKSETMYVVFVLCVCVVQFTFSQSSEWTYNWFLTVHKPELGHEQKKPSTADFRYGRWWKKCVTEGNWRYCENNCTEVFTTEQILGSSLRVATSFTAWNCVGLIEHLAALIQLIVFYKVEYSRTDLLMNYTNKKGNNSDIYWRD